MTIVHFFFLPDFRRKAIHRKGDNARILAMTLLVLMAHATMAQLPVPPVPPPTPESLPQPKKPSKFEEMNKKGEELFKKIPVPILSYSTEAGQTFGLAKFNLFHLHKNDTLTKPSKISAVFTVSTKGRINVSLSNDLILKQNKYMILSFFNYRKQPEYIFGIGNDVTRENVEQVTIDRIKFSSVALRRFYKNLYAGIALDVSDYFQVKVDSNSFLLEDNVPGVTGGTDIGFGFSMALDNRKNRYNPRQGEFILISYLAYPTMFGNNTSFGKFQFDGRKYFTPWRKLKKHVLAVQATTTYVPGDAPFYDLALMGGEDKMRGYYQGAYRDKVLVDAQVEYRMPVWSIFGITTWIGTGRVGSSYSDLALDGFHLSFGGGLRIRVDSKNDTNLRLDWGYGPGGLSGFYINFAEAF